MEEKLAVVDTARKTSKKNAAKLHKVDTKQVREWCKQEEKLLASGEELWKNEATVRSRKTTIQM